MGYKLDRDLELRGMSLKTIGTHSERVMWQKACHDGKMCRAWDQGLMILTEDGFLNQYEREKDGSWSQTRSLPVPDKKTKKKK